MRRWRNYRGAEIKPKWRRLGLSDEVGIRGQSRIMRSDMLKEMPAAGFLERTESQQGDGRDREQGG